jgi:NADPH2:quinone reductase
VFTADNFAADALRATGGRGVDLILDPVGGDTLRRGIDLLATFGRLVSYGNASGHEPWQLGQADLIQSGKSVAAFSILALAHVAPDTLRSLTDRALHHVLNGTVELPITAEFPLDEAAAAHRLMGARTSTGKLLLRTANPA